MTRSISMGTSQLAGSTWSQTLIPAASKAAKTGSNRSTSSKVTLGQVVVGDGLGKWAQHLPRPPPPETSTTTATCSPTAPVKLAAIELMELTHQEAGGQGLMP